MPRRPDLQRTRPTGPSGQRTTLAKAASLFFGVLLPLVCFTVNELLDPFAIVRGHLTVRGLSRWLGYAFCPAVQRPLYPLVLWAILSLAAELFSDRLRFRPWVRTGLKVGVAAAGLFSLLYVAVIPLALAGVSAYGVGLLGLAPFPALVTFIYACKANSAAAGGSGQRPGRASGAPRAPARRPWMWR